jgi:hypothetical protein
MESGTVVISCSPAIIVENFQAKRPTAEVLSSMRKALQRQDGGENVLVWASLQATRRRRCDFQR